MIQDPPPIPANPRALAFAESLFVLFEARDALAKAKAEVPDYTGQYEPEYFVAKEQEEFNRAADALYEAAGRP